MLMVPRLIRSWHARLLSPLFLARARGACAPLPKAHPTLRLLGPPAWAEVTGGRSSPV